MKNNLSCMATLKLIFVLFIVIFSFTFIDRCFAQTNLTGKDVYYKIKGPFGSCNTCHPNGGTAGRWDSEYKEISADGDKIIPPLKGIGKKKTPEQLEKIIVLMKSKYKVPIQDSQIKSLADYISRL